VETAYLIGLSLEVLSLAIGGTLEKTSVYAQYKWKLEENQQIINNK